MYRTVVLTLILTALWLLLSGYFTPLLLSLGGVSVALSLWVAYRIRVIENHSVSRVFRYGSVILYLGWLLKEIVVANIVVAKIILHPRLPIRPTMMRLPLSQRSPGARVLYANSITLTPGTVSTDLEVGHVTVHALTRSGADTLARGEMDARVSALECLSVERVDS